MESRVKEYQELYSKFEDVLVQSEECKRPIKQLEDETEKLRMRQSQFDYTDANVVIANLEKHVDVEVKNKKVELQKEVQNQMSELGDTNGKINKSFNKVIKWLTKKKVDKLISNTEPDFSQGLNISRAYNNTKFDVFSIINKIFAFVFRFDFLVFFPKVLRILASLIVWGIILIPKIVTSVYTKFELKYKDYILGLEDEEYEQALEIIKTELLQASVIRVLVVVGLIILINLVIYYVAKHFAKEYFLKNLLVYMAISEPKKLEKALYDYKLSEFMDSTVSDWNKEIEHIKNNGLETEPPKSAWTEPIRPAIVDGLKKKYEELAAQISQKQEEIEQCYARAEVVFKNTEEIIAELNSNENGVLGMIGDGEHNNGVLSPYVALGFSNEEKHGAKELVSFKHNYKPMLICYDEDSAENGERFRKNSAILIEKFMNGFFGENSMDIIDMWLVDFEGLHFPESRTKGMMKVIRTQQELQNLYSELENTRNIVDSLADGKIATINPDKLRKRENLIKYNIVFFVGVDFASMDRETVQLFIGGENFGFLPILFMRQSIAQNLLAEDNSARTFFKVLKKIKEAKQIYGYEGILDEFEYELMVSNQKRQLDEKQCVKNIMSFKEFEAEAASDEGISLSSEKSLYVDTYEISEKLYETLLEYDFVRFFTINGDVPSFVTVDVMTIK
ncbi:MAG: hypothetical protein GX285_10635 [Clostridiales bacterium]|nr:hypothetical protein [Clostridiales bacterium]